LSFRNICIPKKKPLKLTVDDILPRYSAINQEIAALGDGAQELGRSGWSTFDMDGFDIDGLRA
jgi:hypothetical protein